MSIEPCQRPTIQELRQFDLFKEDDDEALKWLSERFQIVCFSAGDIVVKEGDTVDRLAVVLEGEIHFTRPDNPGMGVFIIKPGEPSGKLPFSRMKTFPGRGVAVKDTRVIAISASYLREMSCRVPCFTEKLVWQMTDRTREFTQMSERNSKMLALGKLSAGLAHELNNPSSAVVRSAARLRELIIRRRNDALALRGQVFPPNIQRTLEELARVTAEAAQNPPNLDDLERSDREEELSEFLNRHHIDSSKACDLVNTGITLDVVARVAETYDSNMVSKILTLLLADYQMMALISEIEEASGRVSQLVQDVKAYSYMDTSPITDIDIEAGIWATLRMFQHQLKHGYTVKKNFAGNLPKICANGNELNQVWTNLIDNAIDAMSNVDADQKILEVRTSEEPDSIVVEIADHGHGIPKEVQGRIFEPFFTTKGVGQGTGLGLDIVQRIVRNHKGSIQLDSKPGYTVFQIRLPK